LNEALNQALKNPDVAAKLAGQGISVTGGSVESARTWIDGQVDTWARVVRENNIKPD
jgi:tripartite-type tricarboxylate transporter receptor subunit TctC